MYIFLNALKADLDHPPVIESHALHPLNHDRADLIVKFSVHVPW